MLRGLRSAMAVLTAPCDHTAVSKDLSEADSLSYDLVSAPDRTNWGCLLADPARSAGKVYRPVGAALVWFVYVPLRTATPEIFWRGRFG